jgi:two-component system sensor histidine kinase RegB
MTSAVKKRAGEPFFTTKAPGRGMGLGLFLARAVVDRLGGSLEIVTERGTGTTVHVMIPIDAQPEAVGDPSASNSTDEAPLKPGHVAAEVH